ncbi:MAG: hypothetical protein Q8N26_04020 [Myxococcales bacterium]|nr:hypothetical protein [Myxococcales bacterium]
MSRCRLLALLAVSLAGCPEDPALVGGAPPTLPTLTPVAATPVAQLVKAEGRVDVERDGGVSKAALEPLFEDDVVVTGPASLAVLRDSEGRELELGEDTRFKVGAKLSSVEVLAGDISFLSDDGGAGWSGLSVRTPYGVARLSGGATGTLRFVDGGVTGSVTFGTFEFDVPDAGTRSASAGESFGVTFGEFEFDTPPVVPPAPTVEGVTLNVEAGKPQLKRPGDKRYSPAKAKESLPAGTAFQLPPGAAARLSGRNVDAVLAAGSSGVAEGERTEAGQRVLALSKSLGPLTLQFSGRGPAVVELGELKVGGGSESSVAVTQVGKKKRVEVRAGEVAVTVNGVATTLKAGDAVLVDAGGAAVAPPTRPGLVVNALTRVRVAADVKELGLQFPADTNRVQVARDPDFAAPFITGTVGKQVVVPLSSKAPMFFRVIDAQGQPTKQGRIDFTPDTASARDTATRTDTVAETGLRATVFYQSKVPALTFQFAAQPDTKAWNFILVSAGALQAPIVERKTSESKLVLDPGVLKEGEYFWSATPLDGNGAPKAGVRMNKLSVVYDNARTSLLIDRPLAGERASPSTTASGVAPRSVQLFINGKLVRPDDSGRFSVKVGAVDQVIFRVVTGETEAWWLRKLKR